MRPSRLILGFTGHRPQSMPGAEKMDRRILDERLLVFARSFLQDCPLGQPDEAISGMAEGWDMAVAEACVELGLPFVAALPFQGQERHWGGQSQARYRALLDKATRVHVVGPFHDRGYYLERDEWIADHSTFLIGLCGKKDGGTAYTMDYADRWCIPKLNLWARWVQLHQ